MRVTPGDFAKFGLGRLEIDATLEVGGSAVIGEGHGVINGEVHASGGLSIANGATVSGGGQVVGDLLNHGLLSPGDGVGTLTTHGHYTHASLSHLLIEVESEKSHDRLVVNGVAILEGTSPLPPIVTISFAMGRSSPSSMPMKSLAASMQSTCHPASGLGCC